MHWSPVGGAQYAVVPTCWCTRLHVSPATKTIPPKKNPHFIKTPIGWCICKTQFCDSQIDMANKMMNVCLVLSKVYPYVSQSIPTKCFGKWIQTMKVHICWVNRSAVFVPRRNELQNWDIGLTLHPSVCTPWITNFCFMVYAFLAILSLHYLSRQSTTGNT